MRAFVRKPCTCQPWTLTDVLNKVGGATGGNQGLPGTVSGIPYEPGGFVDKLMESFAGPHDFLGSLTGYDALGNLTHMSDMQHTLFNLQTDVDIPIASIFAIPTLFSQYGLSAGTYLSQSKEANK